MLFFYLSFVSIFSFLLLNIFFKKLNILDIPDTGIKKHKMPVPYSGGFVIYINFLIIFFFSNSFFFNENYKHFLFLSIYSLVFIIGFIDDILKLSINLRLIFLILIFFLLLYEFSFLKLNYFNLGYPLNFSISFFSISFFVTIFCLLSFVQASNMLDGINCQFGLYFLTLIIYLNTIIINYSIYFIPGLLVFLYFNYNNKSFFGDGGCYLLSFIIGILFIQLYNEEKFYVEKVLSIMLMPGLEMVRLFFNRIINKKNPFKGDRNHLHHLIESKFSSSKAIIISPIILCLPIFFEYFSLNSFFNIFICSFIYILIIFFFYRQAKRN